MEVSFFTFFEKDGGNFEIMHFLYDHLSFLSVMGDSVMLFCGIHFVNVNRSKQIFPSYIGTVILMNVTWV